MDLYQYSGDKSSAQLNLPQFAPTFDRLDRRPSQAKNEVPEWFQKIAEEADASSVRKKQVPERVPPADRPVEAAPRPLAPGDGTVRDVSPAQLRQALDHGSKPVVVDVSATWCGPCQQMKPNVDRLAEQFKGKADVLKVDFDRLRAEDPALASALRVTSVPTTIMFDHGKEASRVVGLRSTEDLARRLNHVVDRRSASEAPVDAPAAPRASDHEQPRFQRALQKLERLTHFSERERRDAQALSPFEQETLRLINNHRANHRLPPVEFDPRLQLIARHHTDYQRSHGMTHTETQPGFRTVSERMAQVGLNGWRENAGTGYFRSPQQLVQMWIDSPLHNAALLGNGNIAAISVRGDKATYNIAADVQT